ncbi:adhesion G protein-coupled receptor F5 [Chanos chanos]|uniref:Adhesion G protein-coupled receptor F5 n=1 Tax=Chanos chanos TaxID=29144 RepID=A0A6J2VA37_CHACN|nr:adhesion G protein-coupled receptor F5-like [Chanos chanos]
MVGGSGEAGGAGGTSERLEEGCMPVLHPPPAGVLALIDLNNQCFLDPLNLLVPSSEGPLFVIKEGLYVSGDSGFMLLLRAGLLLCSMRICFNQGTTTEEFYAGELLIEGNATLDVAGPLEGIVQLSVPIGDPVVTVVIVSANIIAECELIGDQTNCSCASGYLWSGAVCNAFPTCCSTLPCKENVSHFTPLCIPKVNVSLRGTVQTTLTSLDSISTMLTTQFEKLNGFNSLNVTGPREGNTETEFEVDLSAPVSTAKLQSIISTLQTLNVFVFLCSLGMVTMYAPQDKVCYKSQQILNCTTEETAESCKWEVLRQNAETELGPGTQVKVTSSCTNVTSLTLLNVTEIWAGTYRCHFMKGSVSHIASTELRVAVLPDKITITSNPQSADCIDVQSVQVTVSCTIQNSTEPYTVLFKFNGKVATHNTGPNGEKVCEAEGVWPKTKDGETALAACESGRVGEIRRKCNGNKWDTEVSFCVKEELNKVRNLAADFELGLGATQEVAVHIFSSLKNTTDSGEEATYGDVQASIDVLYSMNKATEYIVFEESLMPDFVDSASRMLNATTWDSGDPEKDYDMSIKYLTAVEGLVKNIRLNMSEGHNTTNIQVQVCRNNTVCSKVIFNVDVEVNSSAGSVKTVGIQKIASRLPKGNFNNSEYPSIVVSATVENNTGSSVAIKLAFPLSERKPENAKVQCVFWNITENKWSQEGCNWTAGPNDTSICECDHLTPFTILMSKHAIPLPLMEEITYIGLGISICSLVVFILIEALVWNAVVKSNLSHFRHTSLVNIAICLLLADCSFIASSFPDKLSDTLCLVLVVAKHFFYLAMFFWMLCLSIMLLHQLIFVFSPLRKKTYMILSIFIGYFCPTVTVATTYVYYDKGTNIKYHDRSSCWLTYEAPLRGSIHAFLFPVGTIVFINMFSMIVVIFTLLRPNVAENNKIDEKEAAKSIIKAIVFLTPIFGGTWILGLFVFLMTDSTNITTILVNYAFTIVNSLQGLFILLTGVFGEKRVRDEVLKYVLGGKPTKSESKRHLTSASFSKN